MAAKKSSKSINKSAFVRSLPASMSAADVVTAAKAKGIALSEKYVHTIRYNAKTSARKKSPSSSPAAAPAAVRRGPGRPPRALTVTSSNHGLVGEIEKIVNRIVDQRVAEILKAKLGAILG